MEFVVSMNCTYQQRKGSRKKERKHPNNIVDRCVILIAIYSDKMDPADQVAIHEAMEQQVSSPTNLFRTLSSLGSHGKIDWLCIWYRRSALPKQASRQR